MSIDRRIDQICDEFEARWTAGDRPSLFDFLKQAEGVDQVTLLHELLSIDIEYRNRLTMPVIAEEYAVFGQEAVQLAARVITELRSSRAQELRISESSDEDLTLLPKQTAFMDEAAVASIAQRDEFATIPPKANAGTSTSLNAKVRYFGDYELLEEIARGGMGVVYKARQTNLNRVVALKMILAGQLASDEEVQRFRTEAEAAANLDHPGIVPIYEIGQHEGQHFFSMGYVDGCSLADRVRNGPLPPKEAAELTKKIAEAIAFAHSRNVIHRDLKPANVLLDQNGEPKVTDFGLARKTDTDSGMTRTGAVMGTPSYMPPEQAAGKTSEVGPLSDVYSLGAILYCLLTGRPPFQAANPLDTLLQVMEREPVSVSTINPEIQRDLETICHKCLQKESAKRYSSAQELAEDLGRWLRGEPIQARATSRTERVYRWVKRNRIVSGLLAATALGLFFSTGFAIRARISERNAISSQQQTEATLARSNFFLARSRWNASRPGDAMDLLHAVPKKYRNLEWYLTLREFDQSHFSCFGHLGPVTSVSVSPDGMRVVSGSDDNTVKLWDAATGEELQTFRGHVKGVNTVSFSPNGTRIVSGSSDNSIKLWNTTTGEELQTLNEHSDRVDSVSFSPDGTRIVSGSFDNSIKLWNATTGEELHTFKGHVRGVCSVTFSPDATRIVSGSYDNSIKLWNATTGEELQTLTKHVNTVNSVSFSPDGAYLVSGSGDKTIKLWDALTGEELRTLRGHENGVESVSFSPDGMRIASGSYDNTIKLWDVVTGEELRTLKGHESLVTSVSFSADGTRIVSGSNDTTVKLWDAGTGDKAQFLKGHEDFVFSVSFNPDGTRLVSGSGDKTIKLWHALTGEELRTLRGHDNEVQCVSFSPDGMRIASGSYDNTIKLWDASTGEVLHTLEGHELSVHSVAFSPDGTLIASGSGDNTIRLWDATTGDELRTLKGHESPILTVSFSSDGTRIVSGSADDTVKLWNPKTGEEVDTLQGHVDDVATVAFSPDGSRIVSGSHDMTIRLWDAATSQQLGTLSGHQHAVISVEFSPDGTHVVSGSADRTIKLWDAATFEELWTVEGHFNTVGSVSFSPDGTRIVSGSYDKTIRLWDGEFSEELRRYKPHASGITSASINPEGTRLMGRDGKRTIGAWDVETGMRLTDSNLSAFVPSATDWRSSNERWIAIVSGKSVFLVDRSFKNTPQERARRKFLSEPKSQWHNDQLRLAKSTANHFAAMFHAAWLLKLSPQDALLHDEFHDAYQKLKDSLGGPKQKLPHIVEEALQLPRGTDLPALTEESAATINSEIWALVRKPASDGSSPLPQGQLQKMRDVCSKFPSAAYLTTLGVAEYRDGRSDAAIQTLNQAGESFSAEMKLPGPSPFYLAFLAMAHHKLGHREGVVRYRDQMLATIKEPRYQFDAHAKSAVAEALHVFDGSELWKDVSTSAEFEQEASFEDSMVNHWQVTTWKNRPEQVSLSTDVMHEGVAALKMQITEDADDLSVYQPVKVVPNQQYRLTVWVKTEDVAVGPQESGTTGACLTLYDHAVSTESILGTNEWKQITWEFNSGDASALNIGCRLGSHGSACTGTAWFDDLKLEEIK